jgi:hypothetical protein
MALRYAGGLTFQVTATIRSCARSAAGAVAGLGTKGVIGALAVRVA